MLCSVVKGKVSLAFPALPMSSVSKQHYPQRVKTRKRLTAAWCPAQAMPCKCHFLVDYTVEFLTQDSNPGKPDSTDHIPTAMPKVQRRKLPEDLPFPHVA